MLGKGQLCLSQCLSSPEMFHNLSGPEICQWVLFMQLPFQSTIQNLSRIHDLKKEDIRKAYQLSKLSKRNLPLSKKKKKKKPPKIQLFRLRESDIDPKTIVMNLFEFCDCIWQRRSQGVLSLIVVWPIKEKRIRQ